MSRAAILMMGALVALTSAEAAAATWRVDGDAACSGDGTLAAPWCSLDEAFGSGAIAPGDTIELGESDDPYPAQDFAMAPDGTEEAPIVLQPAPGQAPIIGGQLTLDGRSHWTLRGLTIDARANSGLGIVVRSSTVSSYGVVLEANTIVQASSRSIRIGANGDLPTYDVVIAGNHIVGGRAGGIDLFASVDARVLDNDVEGIECSLGPFFQQEGITVIGDNVGTEIAGNYVHDFPVCSAPEDLYFVGIRARRSSEGEIHHNLIEIDPAAGAQFAGGISLHEESFDFVVHHNVVRDISGCGLCDGADFGTAGGNTWAHNTVVDTEPAMALGSTTGAVMFGNVLRGRALALAASSAGVVTSSQANAYSNDDDSANVIAVGNMGTDTTQWQADCGCDEDVVLDPPALSMLDGLTPEADSPLVGAAEGSTYVPDSADIGALQAPTVGAATVSSDGRTIAVELEVAFPPIASVAGCAGIAVAVDGNPAPIAACTEAGDGLEIELVDPVWRDETVQVEHQGILADAAGIGARLGARVPVFSLEIDTTSLEPRPEGTGETGGTGGPGTGDGSNPSGDDESGTAGATDPGQGCACSSNHRAPLAAGGWVLLLGLLRRRAKTVG